MLNLGTTKALSSIRGTHWEAGALKYLKSLRLDSMGWQERLSSGKHRFLITGGCGFIGSNLAMELLRRGQTVTVLDDFSTGSRKNAETLAALASSKMSEFRLVEGSICDSAAVQDAM